MDPKRRSQIVTLTLIGLPFAAAVAGRVMPAGEEVRRNLYPDRAACERDYSPQQCQPRHGTNITGYHGPYYHPVRGTSGAANDPGPGRSGVPVAIETSTRGGFGSSGRVGRAGG
jgi:hypothetical protein